MIAHCKCEQYDYHQHNFNHKHLTFQHTTHGEVFAQAVNFFWGFFNQYCFYSCDYIPKMSMIWNKKNIYIFYRDENENLNFRLLNCERSENYCCCLHFTHHKMLQRWCRYLPELRFEGRFMSAKACKVRLLCEVAILYELYHLFSKSKPERIASQWLKLKSAEWTWMNKGEVKILRNFYIPKIRDTGEIFYRFF